MIDETEYRENTDALFTAVDGAVTSGLVTARAVRDLQQRFDKLVIQAIGAVDHLEKRIETLEEAILAKTFGD